MASSKSNMYKSPEWLLKVALDDNFRVTETMFTKEGQTEVTRRATLKERIDSAKACAPYFAPQLKSVEYGISDATPVAKMTDAELFAELQKLTGFIPKVENSDGGQGNNSSQTTQEKGPGSPGPLGESTV